MGRAEIEAEEVEEVMLGEARVNIRGVVDAGSGRGDVCQDSGAIEVTRAERSSFPNSAVLQGPMRQPLLRKDNALTWQRKIAFTCVLFTVEAGRRVIFGPAYAKGRT